MDRREVLLLNRYLAALLGVVVVGLVIVGAVLLLQGPAQDGDPTAIPDTPATEEVVETEAASPTDEPAATETVAETDDTTETEEPAETEEAVATEEAAETEEAVATEEATPEFVGIVDGFSITPGQAQLYTADSESIPESLGQPEAGQQWVFLTVSLLNEAVDDPVSVAASDLTLIDGQDNTYSPLEDGGTISPYLVGAELQRDESLRGFVAFLIPEDATPSVVQWCPMGNCDMALRADILLPVTE